MPPKTAWDFHQHPLVAVTWNGKDEVGLAEPKLILVAEQERTAHREGISS